MMLCTVSSVLLIATTVTISVTVTSLKIAKLGLRLLGEQER